MARLIDADALMKNWERDKGRMFDADYFIFTIEHAPTIDAVPVVRCKDCKWCEGYGYVCVCHNPRYGDGYANYQPPHINDEYWCADGERKDNED